MFEVTEQGIITIDTSDIKAEVDEAYKQALSANLNTDVSTPQGQLISNDVSFLKYGQQEAVKALNAMNVLTATGGDLDAAAGIWGYVRKLAQPTVIIATMSGTEGTVIPQNSIVASGDYQFKTLNSVTIGANGKASVEVTCTQAGKVVIAPNTLTDILTPVSGWDSVTNNNSGVVGYDKESDGAFRKRITANWLNIRAKALLGALHDSLAQLDGVRSVCTRENPTKVSAVVDGVTLEPNSVYACIVGGDNEAIAKVFADKKTIGAATNGNVTVSFNDPESGVLLGYLIRRPDELVVDVQVTWRTNYYTPADIDSQIASTLTDYVNNNPWDIGESITGNNLSNAFDNFKYADILSVKVRTGSDAFGDYVDTSIEQLPSLGTITAVGA